MRSKTERVVVTVSIDTECDHDPRWARSAPLSFDSIYDGLPHRLQPVFNAVGAVPTYLLTVEVLDDPHSVKTLKALTGQYEYGTHLHASFIEPQKKYTDFSGVYCPDFQCGYPADIEYQKLDNLTRLFREKLGYQPLSFRAGRFGASHESVDALQRLGYLVDSSVTPHILWREPKAVVDFRHAPEQPYFPAEHRLDRSQPFSRGRILEAPVTIKSRWLRGPRWFRPWFSSVQEMKKIAQYYLKTYSHQPVIHLNMMFHSMEVIERASPYPQTRADVDRFLDDMHQVLRWCADEHFEFCGMARLYDYYADQ